MATILDKQAKPELYVPRDNWVGQVALPDAQALVEFGGQEHGGWVKLRFTPTAYTGVVPPFGVRWRINADELAEFLDLLRGVRPWLKERPEDFVNINLTKDVDLDLALSFNDCDMLIRALSDVLRVITPTSYLSKHQY